MKQIICLSFLVSVVMTASVVKADTLPAPLIGVVAQATLDQSSAFKSIGDQVNKKRAEIQKELATIEKELKDREKKLSEEQKSLPEKDFATKRQEFEKRVYEVQEKIEVRRAQMELAVDDAKKKVFAAFLKVVDEVKKAVGANLIIYKETVVTAEPTFDLSNTVLEKLNKELPTVQVVFKSEAEVKKQLQQQAPL
jgi:outer membrane protein